MNVLSIVLGIIALLVTILGICNFFRFKNQINQIDDEYYKKLEKEYLLNIEEEYKNTTNKLHEEENKLKSNLNFLEKEIETKKTFNENLLELREEELNRIVEEKKKEKIKLMEREVTDWAKSAQEAANENFQDFFEDIARETKKLNDEYSILQKELNEYQEKRNVINQEILRSRAIEENNEFYSVQLDNESEHDIDIFEEIKPKIIKIEKLNKLIYDNYINRPVNEMIKRVLEGKNPTGIYKVTNLQTKEIYIGKSTSIADRWKNHIKSACGLSGVADSQFQRALKKYGIENFSWELLEETTKENLTEREKYWIKFYDTIHYGYNQRLG